MGAPRYVFVPSAGACGRCAAMAGEYAAPPGGPHPETCQCEVLEVDCEWSGGAIFGSVWKLGDEFCELDMMLDVHNCDGSVSHDIVRFAFPCDADPYDFLDVLGMALSDRAAELCECEPLVA